jgi:RimJ/RimL family protein N-acetyltransferase
MLRGNLTGLRAIEKSDLTSLLEWRNKPCYRRYFREYRELSLEHQNNWYAAISHNQSKSLMFSIVALNTGQLLGASGLCNIDWINQNADFSIYIGVEDLYIDEEFAPDASRSMIKYAFFELGLHRIWAEIYSFDIQKKKLLTDLGFRLEGQHRQTHWSENKWHDSLFYGLLGDEFKSFL